MPCRYPLKPHEWPLRLQEGVKKHGDIPKITQNPDRSDVHVFWGMRRPWGRKALAAGKTSIIIERAYLGNRFRWLAFGLNGLNGNADFCNANVPNDRWLKFWRPHMLDWKTGGQYAVVVGQMPGDASLNGIDAYKWAAEIIPKAKEVFGKVLFRPHPQVKNRNNHKVFMVKHKRAFKDIGIDYDELDRTLANAKVVITYSSNVAVDAIMRGIPAISFYRGSMAYEVTTHNLTAPLYRGDREEWGRKIAYAQWLPEEISDGTAYGHIRGFISNGR